VAGFVDYNSTIIRDMKTINFAIMNDPIIDDVVANIYLWFDRDFIPVETANSNGEKYIRTNCLPRGEYVIEIVAPGYLFTYYFNDEYLDILTDWKKALELSPVSPGDRLPGIRLVPQQQYHGDVTISGSLLDRIIQSTSKASVIPKQRSTVSLHAASVYDPPTAVWYLVTTTQSDEDGNYSFTNLPAKIYRISVELPGFQMTDPIIVHADSDGGIYDKQNFVFDFENRTITGNAETTLSDNLLNDGIRLNVYPNPATDVVRIDGFEGAYTVKLFNMSSQIVASVRGTSPELTLHIGYLPSGMYLVSIESQGKTLTKKIIKN
jgi:hypothetical protein